MAFYIDSNGGTQAMRTIAEDVCYETLKHLMPRKRNLDLDILITNTLKEGAYGFAYQAPADEEGPATSYIEIENKPVNLYSFIETLCHECVHIKQYTRNEIKEIRGKTMWKGTDHTDTAYYRQPWEKEAWGVQKELAKTYLKRKGKSMAAAKRIGVRSKEAVDFLGIDA